MNKHAGNALYAIADYVAQPAGMLLAAPLLLHHLGLASYGIWLIATAAVSAGSIISSGFGDAAIQRIANLREINDQRLMGSVVSNVMAINIVLSLALSGFVWLFAPIAGAHITHATPSLLSTCVWSLRMGALLIVIKSVESVFISGQRAFECYGAAVRINTAIRLLTLAVAVGLAIVGRGLIAMMASTLLVSLIGVGLQSLALRSHLNATSLRPKVDRELMCSLAAFGGYSWLQAICGVIFSQADRLLVGTTLGAAAVACYGICVQIAQPIHGLTAAALHFLFPHLAAHSTRIPIVRLRSLISKIFAINVVVAGTLTFLVVSLGKPAMHLWIGGPIAARAAELLPLIAISFGLLALNVTGHYALLAFGNVRLVTALNVVGGCAMLIAISFLWRTHGVYGAAMARLCYGPFTLLMYIPLFCTLYSMQSNRGAVRIVAEKA